MSSLNRCGFVSLTHPIFARTIDEQIPTLRIAMGISEEELFSFELRVDNGCTPLSALLCARSLLTKYFRNEKDIWMNAQRALYDYGFETESSLMVVHSVNSLFKVRLFLFLAHASNRVCHIDHFGPVDLILALP